MMISKEDHKEGRISDKEFKRRLAFCGKKLREAKLCLRHVNFFDFTLKKLQLILKIHRGGFTPVEEYIQKKGLERDAKVSDRREA